MHKFINFCAAGKSFFAVHALSRLGAFGYANFDDEKLAEAKDYNEIINAINSTYSSPKYLLLDEIQNLDRWELFANRLHRQARTHKHISLLFQRIPVCRRKGTD